MFTPVEGHILYAGETFKLETAFGDGTKVFNCVEQCSKTIVRVGRGDLREFRNPHGHRVVSCCPFSVVHHQLYATCSAILLFIVDMGRSYRSGPSRRRGGVVLREQGAGDSFQEEYLFGVVRVRGRASSN
jgi:hypothetical protein